jgi:NiFe hydrogenase small subunit HydA
MGNTLFWIQAGGCGGDSMSLLNIENPDMMELAKLGNIDILWHPSLSANSTIQHSSLIERILTGEQTLDILCIEGSIVQGPGGSGLYDTFRGQPKKDLIAALARQSNFVIAVGTCAGFGGFGSDSDIETTGLQFHKQKKGGLLGGDFLSKSGLPVINLPGCPCHPEVISGTLMGIASSRMIHLGRYNSPEQWYGLLVHQGCARNEYHEYRIEEKDFGKRGCLFFHLGCRGPLTHGPCNKLLWNGRSAKTLVGVPCFGCTDPNFPQTHPFFHTRNIVGIPIELPEGVDRAHYLAYKGMAAEAAPKRLKTRKTPI